ncbi:hypothetical protein [Candidatus Phytoplasma solani]|uniref:hypothetical protein n=1 Tax=Candidatus Phytoplasma solani TaxID=69896 RepID=UPI00358F37E0
MIGFIIYHKINNATNKITEKTVKNTKLATKQQHHKTKLIEKPKKRNLKLCLKKH